MEIGEKIEKEITINDVFTFLIIIERIDENLGEIHYSFESCGLKKYEMRRGYKISIENLGGEDFKEEHYVFGCRLKSKYDEIISKAQHFIDSTSVFQEEDFLNQINN